MSNSLINAVRSEKSAKTNTPQTQQARGDQVQNNAGGFTFKVDDTSRLERFLILGTDGGTYYVNEKKHVKDNVAFLRGMIAKDWKKVVDTIVDVSVNGRAYQNSPAIFAISLALCEVEPQDKDYVRQAFGEVVRTSTHLFEAAEYVDNLGGWGRAKRKAFAEWYESKDAEALAYQVVKYRQRNGWTHKDVLRLAHPGEVNTSVVDFVLGREHSYQDDLPSIRGFKIMQEAKTAKDVVDTLRDYRRLPWETIPTQFLKDVNVWKALFNYGSLSGQALVRNIVRLARLGAFKDLEFAARYAEKLTDETMIRKTRLHPVNFLNAAVTFNDGQIDRNSGGFSYYYGGGRKKDWETSQIITDALDEGFYTSFKTIEPAGKRTMIATDVSGSMTQNALGLDLSCAQVSAAMAMTIARTEPAYMIKGFATQLVDLAISAKTPLNTAMQNVQKRNFGGTDASAAIDWAVKNRAEIDTFVIITDNETYAGRRHPFQALREYRQKTGINARLAVLGVASTGFTIADPQDRGMMDFVGFDANAPRVLADFSAGRI